jgi:hypothetical protein
MEIEVSGVEQGSQCDCEEPAPAVATLPRYCDHTVRLDLPLL